MYHRVSEKRSREDICLEDDSCLESLGRCGDTPLSPKAAMENEKRIRREIANSNERRRMQSINAGFSSLKSLLPKQEGEKLSKAAILQHTADYVYQLEQEKTRLLAQNCQLKRLLNNHQQKDFDGTQSGSDSPKEDRGNACLDNIVTMVPSASTSPDLTLHDLQRELTECRSQLEQERCQRLKYEEYVKAFDGQILIEKEPAKEVSHYQGRTFMVKKNKEFNMECPPQKPTLVVPISTVAPHATIEPVAECDIDIVKEENIETSLETMNTLGCHVSQQPLLYANILPAAKRFKPDNAAVIPPLGTIVTVVSSKPAKIMPTVLEVHRSSDMDLTPSPAEVSNREQTTSPVDDDNQTVYIMNTSNSACQKSLDTICEAIRHLEGEHMFPMEDQQSRLEEEEVVTEESYTVEEEFQHQSVPQDPQAEIVKFAECPTTVTSHPLYSSHAPNSHPIGGSMSNLTLQMMPSEPQEVPLELTTTHRGMEYHCVEERALPTQATPSHSSARPGVIVVKHT